MPSWPKDARLGARWALTLLPTLHLPPSIPAPEMLSPFPRHGPGRTVPRLLLGASRNKRPRTQNRALVSKDCTSKAQSSPLAPGDERRGPDGALARAESRVPGSGSDRGVAKNPQSWAFRPAPRALVKSFQPSAFPAAQSAAPSTGGAQLGGTR